MAALIIYLKYTATYEELVSVDELSLPVYLPFTLHLITFCSFLHSFIACDVFARKPVCCLQPLKHRRVHKQVIKDGEAFPPHRMFH